MPIVRPRINEDWLIKIRCAFPKETAGINTIEGIAEFAFKKALERVQK
jgi:hypothetical protein